MKKNIVTDPKLIMEWSPNNNDTIENYSKFSKKKKLWVCHKNHEYESTIASRIMGSGCPYCANNKILPGYNDVLTLYPQLESHVRGSAKPVNTLSSHDRKNMVTWECSVGHTFDSTVIRVVDNMKRNKVFTCPECSGKKLSPGVNDLLTTRPDVAEYWDYDSNDDNPSDYLAGSGVERSWVCWEGHQWTMSIYRMSRLSPLECPECRKQKVNLTEDGRYAEWWNDDNNIEDYTTMSSYKAQWKCGVGHFFRRKISGMDFTCPYCENSENLLVNTHPLLANEYDDNNLVPVNQITYNSARKVDWVCSENHLWTAAVYQRVNSSTGCPECWNSESEPEKELFDYIVSIYDGEVIRRDRSLLNGKELDIYVPDKNIAVEYNGLYWHSEKFVDPDYHHRKWLKCREMGVNLITIWGDEWDNRKHVVKKMIAHKLGVSRQEKVFARKTIIHSISSREAERFLEENHIQGHVRGSLYLGLFHRDNLVAVTVWRKNMGNLYLDRYATSMIVVGGLGKMLSKAKKYCADNELENIITFSDHGVSDGELYKKLGFKLDKVIPPDYHYLVSKRRVHKFNYRLKRFRVDPNLIYRDGLTERELADINNIPRVWDSGKQRWLMRVDDLG